ncbi:MAG: oxidoreductase [Candidatus Aenigmatarchaeota archaeon]|nr:MAG: oxidoreductase [Candidatus Aenigmarchaeota archaeon]
MKKTTKISKKQKKLRIGNFWMAGCIGCLLEIFNVQDGTLDFMDYIDIIDFDLIQEKNIEGPFDVAFVEGAITNKKEEEELRKIRKESKILVALGSCACFGGISGLKNFVRGRPFGTAKPLYKFVKVDYRLRGCPISRKEFIELVKHLKRGLPYRENTSPVCTECPLKGDDCFLKKGIPCMGPITAAGCDAICMKNGQACEGCRGPIPNANISKLFQMFEKFGMKPRDIRKKFRKFAGNAFGE